MAKRDELWTAGTLGHTSEQIQKRHQDARMKMYEQSQERHTRTADSPGSGAERRSGVVQETGRHWSDPDNFAYIARNATRLAENVTNYGSGTTFMGTPKHDAVSHDQFEPDD